MPVVTIDFYKGRTLEQRREMVKRVTQALVETIQCDPESVHISLRETEPIDVAHGGILNSDRKK